jgi:hypothetical protein
MITKQSLMEIMEPQMDEIVSTWDHDGLIIETQFNFAYQYMFETAASIAYEIITENGGHSVIEKFLAEGETDLDNPICSKAIEVANEGWMYYFYDPYMLEEDPRKDVQAYFEKRR